MRKSNVTCSNRILNASNEGNCREFSEYAKSEGKRVRCIDVPLDVCRMKPIDAETGKKLKRKFTVKKEGVTEVW